MSEHILTKVKRLLALSNNNANVNEAASAYKLAQKLLSENRLSMADVDSIGDNVEEEIKKGEEGLYVGKRAITWKGSLAVGISECNGCHVHWGRVYVPGKGGCKKLTLIGRPSDIAIVQWLYHSVVSQIDSLCKAAMIMNGGGGKTFSNNFKHGAVSAVVARIKEAKQEVDQKYNGTAALVLVKNKDEAVAAYVKKAFPNLRSTKTTSRYDSNGYNEGKRAGGRVNLSRGGLGAGKSKRLLS